MRQLVFLVLFFIFLINIFLYLTMNLSNSFIYFLIPIFFISNLIVINFYFNFLKKELNKKAADPDEKNVNSADEHPIIVSAKARLKKN